MSTLPNAPDSSLLNPADGSVETIAMHPARPNTNVRPHLHAAEHALTPSELVSERIPVRRTAHAVADEKAKRPLRVMKFGGTSVGDANCIAGVVEIIRAASLESDVVVVISAMGGVTNKLINAAVQSQAGNQPAAAGIFGELRKQHDLAAQALVRSSVELDRLRQKTDSVLQEGGDLCMETSASGELPLRTRDIISSLGERLSAPLLAAALTEHGIPSESIEATEVLVTDDCFGGAEPLMDFTRERCDVRVRPLLRKGVIPVITGFIGATVEGELTTLGRGGSDYSATILGAAFAADEVIIWTDVDGVLTSDPRMVPGACTIPEISYREAAELAHYGAKVLHPKTLRPLMHTSIPLWIRNTFSPEKIGTKVTPEGSLNDGGVKALTAYPEAALIRVGGPAMGGVSNVLARTFTAIAAAQADVLLILHSSSQNDVRFVVPAALAVKTVETLSREFGENLAGSIGEHITLDSTIGIITVVGQNMREVSAIIGRTFNALQRESVNIIAIAQGSSDCNVSFVVARKDLKTALTSAHGEFQLGVMDSEESAAK